MHDTVLLVRKHLRTAWRFRWLALIIATFVSIIGWLMVLSLPDQYQVSTKVYMDTSSMLRPLLRGLAIDTTTRLNMTNMVRRTLLTRPNLETIARKTDMDLEAKTPAQLEELIERLGREIRVSGTTRDNIFNISYSNSDPKLATRVVEALLSMFVERSLGETRKDASNTRIFIEEQIAEYESRLRAAEARLKEFKQNNMGLMPSQGEDYYGRLRALQSAISESELALREAVQRRDALKKQLREPAPGFTPGLIPSQYDERINSLEVRLDDLLLRFTEEHPDVVATRRVMEDLERKREEEFKQMRAALQEGSDDGLGAETRVVVGQAEAEVAALRARLDSYRQREKELQSLVDTVLDVEAQYAQLNRDYGIYKGKYQALVERRETLYLSEEASQSADQVQFNVIEPPREPITATGPNRERLNAGVFVFALGTGAGLGWLFGLLRPTVSIKEEFAEFTELPVLGVVSRLWTPAMRLRRSMEVASFGLASVCLLALFAAVSGMMWIELDVASTLNEFGFDRISRFGLDRLGQIFL